jgi:uncharacterized membrane protein
MDISAILIRASHIVSVVFLIGTAFYTASAGTGLSRANAMANRIYGAMTLLVVSGGLLFMERMTGAGFPKGYHMWFGIKMLFALHILAVFLLLALGRGDESKQRRWLVGIAGSGLVTILLAAVLRSFSR